MVLGKKIEEGEGEGERADLVMFVNMIYHQGYRMTWPVSVEWVL